MESTTSQTAEGMALVQVLAQVLERLVASNAHVGKSTQLTVTKFHALKAPAISVLHYLERVSLPIPSNMALRVSCPTLILPFRFINMRHALRNALCWHSFILIG
jgi:hypothetical protein